MTDINHTPGKQLTDLARTTASGFLAGGMLSRVPVDIALQAALGLLLICLPLDFLTETPYRLAIRICGITLCIFALHAFNTQLHFTIAGALLWLFLVLFAANRDVKRR
ncbi:hypothetical protein [Leclercia adecarboxylata]|uniref:hypothetical protein n=1 Tax=Leclercia adecarboxylata TaxID=83655 RepID=UPI0013C9A014|nr:hypothetical protein [Leclercia adecarboxylata]NEG94358.1 hypothetical protein [Leclercia adecarboxylata]